MMGFIIAIHVAACFLLVSIVLIQSGRGGGLVESFSSMESMFGTKTNTFLTRSTTVLAVLFFLTCLSLAFLSARQSKSLMERLKQQAAELPKVPVAAENATTEPQQPQTNPPQPELPKGESSTPGK